MLQNKERNCFLAERSIRACQLVTEKKSFIPKRTVNKNSYKILNLKTMSYYKSQLIITKLIQQNKISLLQF